MKKSIACIISNLDSYLTWSFYCFQDDNELVSNFEVKLRTRKGLPLEEITKAAAEVVGKLTEISFTNIPVYVGLNINKVFTDHLVLPSISNKELKKAYDIELRKLFPEHETKYIESTVANQNEFKQVLIDTMFCDKVFYGKCLYLLKAARLKVKIINMLPIQLKNLFIDNKALDQTENKILVIIEKKHTHLILVSKSQMRKFELIDCGTNNLYKAFATNKFGLDEEDKTGAIANDTINSIFNVICEAYEPILFGLKRILGKEYAMNEMKIYIHSKKDINSIIIGAFTHHLHQEVLPINIKDEFQNQYIEAYATFTNQRSNVDFDFPEKVK